MKALSIRQPWCWAILAAGKRIENRSRVDGRVPAVCCHRGPLLIHASKGCTEDDWYEAATWMRAGPLPPALLHAASATTIPLLRDLPRGGIVGICTVEGCVFPDGSLRVDGGGARDVDLSWRIPGSYGLVLANVRPLPFVPWKGSLGLFEVPEAALEIGAP